MEFTDLRFSRTFSVSHHLASGVQHKKMEFDEPLKGNPRIAGTGLYGEQYMYLYSGTGVLSQE